MVTGLPYENSPVGDSLLTVLTNPRPTLSERLDQATKNGSVITNGHQHFMLTKCVILLLNPLYGQGRASGVKEAGRTSSEGLIMLGAGASFR